MPQQLVERLEIPATVAAWPNDKRKCVEFFLCLREAALSWYNTLDHIMGFNKESWPDMKREYLAAYAPKHSAQVLCINFQDLQHKADEPVQKFYNRVSDTFINAYKTKPNHTVMHEGELHVLTQVQMNKVMGQGIEQTKLLMMNTMFLGGLCKDIQSRVLEDAPAKPRFSVTAAQEIESILNDKKKDKDVFVTSIEESEPKADNGLDMGEVDKDKASHLNVINAVLR